jgi:hypothetical protein
MGKQPISRQDMEFAATNNQQIATGTSIVVSKPGGRVAYFILAVFGATAANLATVKDAAGVTVNLIDGSGDEFFPIRLEGGFDISAGSAIQVKFCAVHY